MKPEGPRDVTISLDDVATFEEVRETCRLFTVRDLKDELPVQVELDASKGQSTLELGDLPTDEAIILRDLVVGPAVFVSVETPDSPAFHLRLRALIYLR